MSEPMIDRAASFDVADDLEAINRLYRERRWSDGLPIVPPTAARVERMLTHSRRGRHELVARVAPGFGAATVERIAINVDTLYREFSGHGGTTDTIALFGLMAEVRRARRRRS